MNPSVVRYAALGWFTALLGLAACGADQADGIEASTEAAISWSQLTEDAKAFAERFDFEAGDVSSTAVDRGLAPLTGPFWVRRAFALHRAWEDNDLGVARLFCWTVSGRRVWAIRTSTDGDDSFVELFDGYGRWLATGVGFVAVAVDDLNANANADGGVGSDLGAEFREESEAGFRSVISWDETLGEVRGRLAPADLFDEGKRFYDAVLKARSNESVLGPRISKSEVEGAIDVLMAGPATTASLDGWDRAFVLRLLADRTVDFTPASERYALSAVTFYQDTYLPLQDLNTPSVVAALGVPARLEARIAYARATFLTGESTSDVEGMLPDADRPPPDAGERFFDVGHRQMNQLVQGLGHGMFVNAAVPAGLGLFESDLRSVGLSLSEVASVVERLGASASGAHLYRGDVFHFATDGWPVPEPGMAWFIVSPQASFVSLLCVRPPEDASNDLRSRGLQAVAEQTGVIRNARLVQVRSRPTKTYLDLSYEPPDGALSIVVELSGAHLSETSASSDISANLSLSPIITISGYSQGVDADARRSFEDAIGGAVGMGTEVLGLIHEESAHRYFALAKTETHLLQLCEVAYRDGMSEIHGIDFLSNPNALNDDQLARLALSAARAYAAKLVVGLDDDVPLLEVLLRTMFRTPSDLEIVVDPEESAVGFDPRIERAQYMLGSVWGDNAVFVTFAFDGTARVEDFN